MMYSEIIAVCSEIHTKHINRAVRAERRVCVKLVVHIVTTGPYRVKIAAFCYVLFPFMMLTAAGV